MVYDFYNLCYFKLELKFRYKNRYNKFKKNKLLLINKLNLECAKSKYFNYEITINYNIYDICTQKKLIY